jgi:hypothetical protein
MQRKFRLNDETWTAFINKTNSPSDTLRELVNNYLNNDSHLEKIMGADEASTLWGLSPSYIKDLCAHGKIKCKKIGKTWVIDKTQPNPSKSSD